MGETFVAPDVDWAAVWPVAAVLGAAVLGVLLEAFLPRPARAAAQLVVALAGLVVAGIGVVVLWGSVAADGARVAVSGADPETAGSTSMVIDQVSLFLQGSLVLMGAMAVLTMAERSRTDAFAPQASAVPGSAYESEAIRKGLHQTEVLPLTMFAVGGMMIFASSADLLTMFVALEVFSLPLYILCGMARYKRLLSQEASLKYFLLGAFSSALFLFGIAFLYGVTGSVSFAVIRGQLTQFVSAGDSSALVEQLPIVVVGVVMVLVGLLFKIGAAPFHAWTPDVYTGAPTPVTGFMAACTKLAAFGALVRVLFIALQPIEDMWQPALLVVATITMVLGAVLSILQNDVKRILAYSSIAHAGFVLTGFATLQGDGIRSVLFYVLAYGLSTIAAFGIIALVREVDADRNVSGEATMLEQWSGLGRRSPVVAGAFAFLMLAFTGIPLTSGFTAKFGVFSVAVQGGQAWLAVVGVAASAVTAFVYLRVIVVMYFADRPDGADAEAVDAGPEPGRAVVVHVGPLAAVAVAVGVAATLVLGVAPSAFLDLAGAVTVAGP